MRSSLIARCVVFAGLSVLVVFGSSQLHGVNHTTVALLLVLLILLVATRWGSSAATVASIAGGLAFDYFFLPPRGFGLEAPEHWIALGAFLLTAITTGQLSARATRYRHEAERRRDEISRLYRLGNALLASEGVTEASQAITDRIVEIFGARTTILFDLQSGKTFRSGPETGSLTEHLLRKAAASGNPLLDKLPGSCVVPIWRGGEPAGSLGIEGGILSRGISEAIAERIGVALARSYMAEQAMSAEVARRSENLKSAILDALAHEIRGPLATLKVSVSALLSQRPGNSAQQRELLTIINEESDRIDDWISNTIQISGSKAVELRVEKSLDSIGEVTLRALEGLGPQAGNRSIDVRIPDSVPRVAFDAAMIEKVIRLLLDNALKYSPAGSPIAVSAEFMGAELVLNIADHGCGIPVGDRERIFEKYYRGNAGKDRAPGTGLGLASAKCIMEAHGGEIWVTGAPGGGSVFHISLPAAIDISVEASGKS